MGVSPRKHHVDMNYRWKQAGAVLFFVACSITAVLLNKALFKNYQFPCPMLTTAIQFAVALLIMVGIYVFGLMRPEYRVIETLSIKADIAFKVLPVSLTFLCMVCFNNWFLMNVGVGFYAIAKSLSVPCSVVLTYLILGDKTSLKSIAACVCITAGVFLGSYGDAEITATALALGGLSSVFTAGYQIAVKHGLNALKGDQWQLGFYNSLWCACLLAPLGLFMGEGAVAASALLPASGAINWPLVVALGCSGVVGFLIAQATYMSIHYTSALAHHVTGAFKSCLQSFLGFMIWNEAQNVLGVSGLLLTLLGSYGFLMSRMEANKQPHAAPAPQPPKEAPLNKNEQTV